jgi:peptide/nickel transport system permease protein
VVDVTDELVRAWRMGRRSGLLQLCLLIVAVMAVLAIVAPLLPLPDPGQQHLKIALSPPFWQEGASAGHPLGTDYLGRDILARIVFGTRVSLLVGVAAVAVAALVGIPLGLVGPYLGGWADEGLMRVMDVVLSIPTLLVAIAVLAVFGASLPALILVLGFRSTVYYARTLRSRVLSVREEQYVKAARAMGVSGARIVVRHLLPNSISPLIVLSSIYIGLMIILESSLSFLGLTRTTISWGFMVAESLNYLATAWWAATFPGLCIFLIVLSMNVIGDFLRDVFDPRLQAGGG